MDGRGAAESESGSVFSAASAGEEVDFRLPVAWKNLLKTACLAGAGPAAAEPPEAGFRRDIAGQTVTAWGRGRAGGASPHPLFRCVRGRARRDPDVRRGGGRAGGGLSPAQMGSRRWGGHHLAPILTASSGPRANSGIFTVAVMDRPLNCIVAVSQNMGIGKNGNLPWPPLRYLPGTGRLGVSGQGWH